MFHDKMKYLFVSLLISVVAASTVGDVNPTTLGNGVYDYHRRIGIPEANRIRKLENEIAQGQSRVVGGSTTTVLSVPYQAGLIMTIRTVLTSVCGGTIISDTRILTAAHCSNDGNNIAQSFTVVLGSNLLFSGGTRINTNNVVLAPGYNPWIVANDLAILRISRIRFSLTIQSINLPSGSGINSNYVGSTALASGYGITRDGDTVGLLQTISSVNLQVISNSVCANTYGNIIQGSHLCTSGSGRVGICGGDTGGPLVTTVNGRRTLIGVGSFTSRSGCQAGQPSGFTRVTSFLRWIQSI